MKKVYLLSLSFTLVLFLLPVAGLLAQATTPVPPPEAAVGTWQCLRGSERMQGVQYMNGNLYNTPVVKWTAPLPTGGANGGCEGEAVIGDVDGDGLNDIVVTVAQTHDLVALNGATGSMLWTKAGVAGYTSAMIGDANGDGSPDIVVCSKKAFLIDGPTGNVIWSFTPAILGNVRIETSPNMADLDHDGTVDVIVVCQDAVYSLNGKTGTQQWKYATGNPDSGAYNGSAPAIGDLNGDGILDVVTCVQNGGGSLLVALNGANGSLLWSRPEGALGLGAGSPAIGDVNGDCKLDVVYHEVAMNGIDGSVIWSGGETSQWCIIANLLGDCNVEVVTEFGVLDGKTGATIWHHSNGVAGWFAHAPRVGDFDPNSPGLEIIEGDAYQIMLGNPVPPTSWNYKPLTMYNGYTGDTLWTMDLANVYNHTVEGISVGDVDNDGCDEIVIVPDCCGGNSTLMVLDDAGNTANCGILASISQVDFLPRDTTIALCNPNGCADFRDFSAPCTNGWNWTFQGATPATSTAQNPGNICFNNDSGTYTVTMIANLNGCPDTVTHTVMINCSLLPPPPVAQFQSSDSSLCQNDCISFTDLSTNNPTSWLWTFSGAQPATSTAQNPPFVCYDSAGTWSVTLVASNSGGNSNPLTLQNLIVVKPQPVPPSINQNGAILSVPGIYTSYQWYDSTQLINGATTDTLVITQGGNYNLVVTDANGCSIAVGIFVILSVKDYTNSDQSIEIYPNPATNQLFVVTNVQGVKNDLKIYNALGEICHQSAIITGSTEIDISDLSSGMYYVRFTNDKGSRLLKFIKE